MIVQKYYAINNNSKESRFRELISTYFLFSKCSKFSEYGALLNKNDKNQIDFGLGRYSGIIVTIATQTMSLYLKYIFINSF